MKIKIIIHAFIDEDVATKEEIEEGFSGVGILTFKKRGETIGYIRIFKVSVEDASDQV